jgi:opacity protein-like surface antigen
MMSSVRRSLCCLALALAIAAPAAAQSWSERVFVSFNGAYQTASNDFTDRFEFERDLETGSTSSQYPVKAGFTFDVGAGYRLWKNLGAGVSVSYFTRDDVARTRSSSISRGRSPAMHRGSTARKPSRTCRSCT